MKKEKKMMMKMKKRKKKNEGDERGRGRCIGFEDGPLFLRAWPVSRLMNCIIGNPEYKLGFAITSPNG